MRALTRILTAAILTAAFMPYAVGYAQSAIEVQRLAASGDYLGALSVYQRLPQRIVTTDTIIAAARSAWALGLPDRAISEFDRALRDESLDPIEQARIHLSRGIIEFQEGHYQVAILFAERVIGLLSVAGPLRSQAWLLWAQSLERIGSYGAAEERFLKALDEAASESQAELHFHLGMCQMKLGKMDSARKNFEQVPLADERTPDAMRHLAEIALDSGELEQVDFWLTKGRQEYPDSFLDSWVDYALARVAIERDDGMRLDEVFTNAQREFPPSDQWFSLLRAAVETYRCRGSKDSARAQIMDFAVKRSSSRSGGDDPRQGSAAPNSADDSSGKGNPTGGNSTAANDLPTTAEPSTKLKAKPALSIARVAEVAHE